MLQRQTHCYPSSPATARSTALAAGRWLPQAPYVGTKSMQKRKICAGKGLTQRNRSSLSSQKLYWDLYWERPCLNAELTVIPHTSCSCSIAKWCVQSILLLFCLLSGFGFTSLFLWGVQALWCGVYFSFYLNLCFRNHKNYKIQKLLYLSYLEIARNSLDRHTFRGKKNTLAQKCSNTSRITILLAMGSPKLRCLGIYVSK